RRVTERAARDRIELALLATAHHPTVQPGLERVTHRRLGFTATPFHRLGFSPADAERRALPASTAYLGPTAPPHPTTHLLPRTQAARRAYLNDVVAALASLPGEK